MDARAEGDARRVLAEGAATQVEHEVELGGPHVRREEATMVKMHRERERKMMVVVRRELILRVVAGVSHAQAVGRS